MENEIGEYGRTNLGNIIKFAWFQNSETGETYKNKVILVDKMMTETYPFYYFKKDEYIVKHSPNLKDIIQKDDFVNKCRVFEVEEKGITVYQTVEDSATDYNWISFDEIQEIVTKEMMESISFKVTKM